jgi:photosystem II stability/assembly factor-like uncharacterized protein
MQSCADAPHLQTKLKLIGMKYLMAWAVFFLGAFSATSQTKDIFFDPSIYKGLEWRNIGPFRGGRCVAVAGLPNDPLTYYMGSTGGGVWKTEDAGLNWSNISDGFFEVGSIGAIAIAPSDPSTIYVGTGEHAIRGVMTSHGNGVYRSRDGGQTWEHAGLKNSRHIAAIQIHPKNPDLLWVAVQGAAHGESTDRGVYRSEDGGISWQRVLYINTTTGCADLSIDYENPRILYATMWDHIRTPWQIRSGGTGSGLYKSSDGGLNWEQLCNGLPQNIGKAGIAVSPANKNIVYAIIEGEQGGVYRSDNGGKHWEQSCSDRKTIARAWYYTEIVPDPQNEETVYVLNAPLLKSIDGGRTFESIPNPHSDQHALWINPHDSDIMILGNDGGATVSFNGGKSWTSQNNQPTAQFYRVIADNRFPYYLYGGQQDNTSVAIPSRTNGPGIQASDWYPVAGGESAFIALDPNAPHTIYGGSYQGNLSVYDATTKFQKDIMAYPSLELGMTPAEMKYRFNWNAPLLAAPQQPQTLYHAANVVFKSIDGGNTWTTISPDLTRDEKEKQGKGGVPYTNEGAGGENYNTISYLACSSLENKLIWAGSDDGLLHLTRDEGQSWQNVTPPQLGEALINCIEPSPFQAGAAYIVATRYKFNDFTPLAFYTEDYGKSWTTITNGIRKEDFLRVIRADKKQEGLLYAGAETGFYVSFDNGRYWQHLQLNLPVCPINDLTIQDNDLIAATSGRSFWILDDLSAFQQSAGQLKNQPLLFTPKPAVRFAGQNSSKPYAGIGKNPLNGVIIDYYLPENKDSAVVQLKILDDKGQLIRSYSNQKEEDEVAPYEGGPQAEKLLPSKKGINRFNWDMRRPSVGGVPGVFVFGQYQGSMLNPGEYQIELIVEGQVLRTSCRIMPDPRLDASPDDYMAQQAVLHTIEENIQDIHRSVNNMRNIKSQMSTIQQNLKKIECTQELINAGDSIVMRIENWENQLIQTQQKTYQDVINFPNRLSADLLDLKRRADSHDPRLTSGVTQRLDDLLAEWTQFKKEMKRILEEDITTFNQLYNQNQIPAIVLPFGAE